jgi:hypothetical protein
MPLTSIWGIGVKPTLNAGASWRKPCFQQTGWRATYEAKRKSWKLQTSVVEKTSHRLCSVDYFMIW